MALKLVLILLILMLNASQTNQAGLEDYMKESLPSPDTVSASNAIKSCYLNFLSDGVTLLVPSMKSSNLQLNLVKTNPLSLQQSVTKSAVTTVGTHYFVHYTYLGYNRFVHYGTNQATSDHGVLAYIEKYDGGVIRNDSKYSGQFALDQPTVITGYSSTHNAFLLDATYVCSTSKVVLMTISITSG